MKRYVAKAVKAAGGKRTMRQFTSWPRKKRAEARRLAFRDWTKWIAERAAARAGKAV